MKKIFLLILFILCAITNSYAIVSTKQVVDCVEIVLKNGIKIQAQIIESSATSISYRICNAQDTSVRKLEKKDISTVKTMDGKIIYQDEYAILNKKQTEKSAAIEAKDIKKYDGLAIVSLILALLSLVLLGFAQFIPSIISAFTATVLGGIFISKEQKSKGKSNFSSLSKAGVSIGMAIFLIMLLLMLIYAISVVIYIISAIAMILSLF